MIHSARTARAVATRTAVAAATLAFVSLGAAHAQDATLETDDQKVSHGLGMMIGEQLKQFGDVDFELFMQGMQAQNSDAETAMSVQEAQQVLQSRQQQLAEAQRAEAAAEGEAFLAENAAREEVTLGGAIAYAKASGEWCPVCRPQAATPRRIEGSAGAPGLAIGRAAVVIGSTSVNRIPDRLGSDPAAEEITSARTPWSARMRRSARRCTAGVCARCCRR